MEISQGNSLLATFISNKQKCHFFVFSSTKSENRREEQVLSRGWGFGVSGRGEVLWKRGKWVNTVQKFLHMHVNAKMIPVESITGMGEREWRRVLEEINSNIICLRHCKNLCRCHNVPPPSTTIKGGKIK
jgi:hypothetical protein